MVQLCCTAFLIGGKRMGFFLAGMILVVFDFSLKLSGSGVAILPDVLGYLLLWAAVDRDGIFSEKKKIGRAHV